MSRQSLSGDRLRQLVFYDALSGEIRRIADAGRGGRFKAGTLVGGARADGYQYGNVDGQRYLLHRLAWLWVHRVWPSGQIDHINGDRGDNRLVNLRDVKPEINCQNQRKARGNSKCGVLGVRLRRSRWGAEIKAFGKRHYLGLFDTAHEAHAAYVNAKRRLHEGGTL